MAYLHRKNELSRSRHSKVRALTHADRQAYDQITTAGSRVVKITNIGPGLLKLFENVAAVCFLTESV